MIMTNFFKVLTPNGSSTGADLHSLVILHPACVYSLSRDCLQSVVGNDNSVEGQYYQTFLEQILSFKVPHGTKFNAIAISWNSTPFDVVHSSRKACNLFLQEIKEKCISGCEAGYIKKHFGEFLKAETSGFMIKEFFPFGEPEKTEIVIPEAVIRDPKERANALRGVTV